MARDEDVTIRLRTSGAAGTRRDLEGASRAMRGFHSSAHLAAGAARGMGAGILAVGRALRTGGLIGIGALGAEAVRATKGWADHTAQMRRSRAVIASTGSAARVTARHVERLTDRIEKQSGVDGDLALQGANLLLTFTNIRNGLGKNNQIFDQATGVVVNMSKALGQDTKNSAIQLGKALNDPIKGITALRRVGVSFDAQQQKQIKRLVEHGKTMEAQRIILRELNREFPRVRATPWESILVTMRKLEDALGGVLLPIVNRFMREVGPRLDHVANTISAVMDDKNLKWSEKFRRIGRSIRYWFGPIADRMVQALRDAHLDRKLEGVIEWATPKVVHAFQVAGPQAANAIWRGFRDAPLWTKAVGVGFLLTRFGLPGGGGGGRGGGAFGRAGGLGAAAFRAGFDMAVGKLSMGRGIVAKIATIFTGRGSTPANPLFVSDVAGIAGVGGKGGAAARWLAPAVTGIASIAIPLALGALATYGIWRLLHSGSGGPPKRTGPQGRDPTGGPPSHPFARSTAHWVNRNGRWVVDPGSAPVGHVPQAAPSGPLGLGASGLAHGGVGHPIVVHTHVHVDGKEVARAVTRAGRRKAALK